jgi:uncharacterized membrane protein (UPF0136 family)
MKNFFKENIWLWVIIGLSGLILWPLFVKGYFPHQDDLQVMRIFEMRKCFTDLQIPCRWVADMGFGNGFPLFNYYGVLPYYLGAVFSFILSYVNSAKILFFIPLLLGGISMYFLGKELFGKKAGFVAGILFLFAPYRALDTYVRGAIAESFALSIIPLVFYFGIRLIRYRKPIDFIGTSLSLLFFLTSHNIMTLLSIPVFLVWLILILYLENWKNIKILLLSLLFGFGLSAFFIIPAYFEKNLVQTNTLTVFALDFRNHFISVSRLFTDRLWGYVGATKSLESSMSFQIGWPHWWLFILSVVLIVVGVIKSRKTGNLKSFLLPAFLVAVFCLSIFMIHNKSTFIWEKIGILSYVQFPWRFLAISIFSASLLGGYCISVLKWRYVNILATLIVVLTIVLNWSYFRPKEFDFNVTDATKLSGESWLLQQSGSVTDYLPITATVPAEPAPVRPLVISGVSEVSNFINKSNKFSFSAIVTKESTIDVPIFDFPDWQVKVNGNPYQHNLGNIGRIEIKLLPGKYLVEGVFKNTPIRNIANAVTLVSLVFFGSFLIYAKSRKIFK